MAGGFTIFPRGVVGVVLVRGFIVADALVLFFGFFLVAVSVGVAFCAFFGVGFDVFAGRILQVVLVALKFDGDVLCVNGKTRNAGRVHGERGVVSATNVKVKARAIGHDGRHGFAVFNDFTVAVHQGFNAALKLVQGGFCR